MKNADFWLAIAAIFLFFIGMALVKIGFIFAALFFALGAAFIKPLFGLFTLKRIIKKKIRDSILVFSGLGTIMASFLGGSYDHSLSPFNIANLIVAVVLFAIFFLVLSQPETKRNW